ncbi:hypothetical protein GCM10009069_18760 [Algimonas arctica]|uniref:Uncharacterized protein n=1 Tax=Algimonas arctica TaxID=1479486 RepID=A0A8J3CRR2_9PROT|nr:hypothetical protein [Algimonas arctica]GHA96065.1 hypothetical protein GCM10009069_18760 [Algimonas arctica]
MPDDLKQIFETSVVPAPRADLSERIIAATQAQAPLMAANDRKPWFQNSGFLSAAAGIAATVVAGFFVISSQPNEAELWAAHADVTGFGELYAWVDADVDIEGP